MRHKADEEKYQVYKNILLFLLIVVIVSFLAYLFYSTSEASGRSLIPLSILPLLAGVLFEGKRLAKKWSTVFAITLGALALSMYAFMPGKHERHYEFANHVAMWPYWFIFVFAVISIVTHGKKVIPQLTEGITLLQSIALAYWVIDYGFVNIENYFLKGILVIGLLFSLFSFFHAFTYLPLSRGNRLGLSLWSSVIMLLFAIDNVYRVYQNERIESSIDTSHGVYIALQFFLLGVSAIYMIQNAMMLLRFLPSRQSSNSSYFNDIRELKTEHIERYSEKQVSIGYSFICTLLATITFSLNYYFQILPRHLAIWSVFIVVPLILNLFANRSKSHLYASRG